jgi:hypothetical protein
MWFNHYYPCNQVHPQQPVPDAAATGNWHYHCTTYPLAWNANPFPIHPFYHQACNPYYVHYQIPQSVTDIAAFHHRACGNQAQVMQAVDMQGKVHRRVTALHELITDVREQEKSTGRSSGEVRSMLLGEIGTLKRDVERQIRSLNDVVDQAKMLAGHVGGDIHRSRRSDFNTALDDLNDLVRQLGKAQDELRATPRTLERVCDLASKGLQLSRTSLNRLDKALTVGPAHVAKAYKHPLQHSYKNSCFVPRLPRSVWSVPPGVGFGLGIGAAGLGYGIAWGLLASCLLL